MSATMLKFIMAFIMVLDHIEFFISPELAAFFHLISRPVAPVFAYLAIEGFIHTRNQKKYISRLYLAAFAMILGNFIINNFVLMDPGFFVRNNIFLSLALGTTSLYIYEEYFKNQKLLGLLLIFLVLIVSLSSEGGIFLVPFMLICYINRDNTKKRNIILIMITAFLAYGSYGYLMEMNIESTIILLGFGADSLFFIAGIPFMYLYNGKRGLSNQFTKYFFYVFYPLHLWIIHIIAAFNIIG
ncbi:MAG: hypothetical protein GXZ08_02070 [Tissierellia bacterium]|nr:hypothetical protein [Tissierellia bacterium]